MAQPLAPAGGCVCGGGSEGRRVASVAWRLPFRRWERGGRGATTLFSAGKQGKEKEPVKGISPLSSIRA